MAELDIFSYACAETDSKNPEQISNNSFDIGAFSRQVNESFAFFDLSALPPGALVSKIQLILRQKNGSYYSREVNIKAALCSNYIDASRIIWNYKPEITDTAAALTFSGNIDAERKWSFDRPSELTRYINGGKAIFKFYIEGASAGDNNAKGFVPSSSSGDKRPRLHIEYDVSGGAKVYLNGSFTEKPVKVFNKGQWQRASVKRFSDGRWQR